MLKWSKTVSHLLVTLEFFNKFTFFDDFPQIIWKTRVQSKGPLHSSGQTRFATQGSEAVWILKLEL